MYLMPCFLSCCIDKMINPQSAYLKQHIFEIMSMQVLIASYSRHRCILLHVRKSCIWTEHAFLNKESLTNIHHIFLNWNFARFLVQVCSPFIQFPWCVCVCVCFTKDQFLFYSDYTWPNYILIWKYYHKWVKLLF